MIGLLDRLQNPVPQYVLGCLPALATIGAAPMEDFIQKLMWLAQCLGCPYLGLFYTCNVKISETAIYWLPKRCFVGIDGKEIPYRPFGHRAMVVIKSGKHSKQSGENTYQYTEKLSANASALKKLEACIANASVLERLSSLVSAYYIFVGIFSGIKRENSSWKTNSQGS
ncbi:242_t:CDS:2 [Ambispora gerdemannii]|uniref:242_t:CDS:1 n=1 Tax=Ambispora gerdemannii TaxID=144530 RepID=A0A9N9F617_9GLOM|nr:242_t:CDS:2 [Ambispora gerdemannii]